MNVLLLTLGLAWSSVAAAGPAEAQADRTPPPPPSSNAPAPAPAAKPKVAPQQDVKKHSILFFTASWCPACLSMKSQTLPNVLLPGHDLRIVDVDQFPQIVQSYGIQSLPAYIVLDGVGRAYRQGVGFRDVRQFVDFLNAR